MIFTTVNCGTNKLTNITVKSILHFHPKAKIFIIDVPNEQNQFSIADQQLKKNIEILPGISRKDTPLPIIDINLLNYLTDKQKDHAKHVLGNPYKLLFRGSLNHQANIQLAIDNISENFILVDSDAPLIHSIDFVNDKYITVADIADESIINTPCHFLADRFNRFIPFVQYLNVKMMNEYEIYYYNKELVRSIA